MARFFKQIIYAVLYLLFFSLVGYWLYLAFRSPAGCTNLRQDPGEEGLDCGGVCSNICLPPDFEQISVSGSVEIFRSGYGQAAIVAKISNGNQGVAAESFKYHFDIKDDSGAKLGSVAGESFIYAGELKYLVEFFRSQDASRATSAEFVLDNATWRKKDDFPRPSADFAETRTNIVDNGVEAVGRLANKDVVNLAQVTIVAVFKNKYATTVGVSRTELQDMQPGETREFRVFHPPVENLDVYRTEYSFSALRKVAQ